MEKLQELKEWYFDLPFSQQALLAGALVGGAVATKRLLEQPELLQSLLDALAFPFEFGIAAVADLIAVVIPSFDDPTDRLYSNATGGWDTNGPLNFGG